MKKTTLFFLNIFLLLCCTCGLAQEYEIIGVSSGFNSDVIANGTGPSSASTTHRVDSDNFNFLSRDFKANANSPAATVGLPIDGVITASNISGLSFQMQPYDRNNSLRITELHSSHTLVFSSSVKMQKMYLLTTGGSAGDYSAFLSATVKFSDGSSQTVSGLRVADWYGGSVGDIVISGIGRINVTNDHIEAPSGNPKLFSVEIPLDVINYTKEPTAVIITKTANSGAVLNVFAVSALKTPNCLEPQMISVSNVTATTATVNWLNINLLSGLGCEYELRTSGAAGSGSVGLVETGTTANSVLTKDFTNLLDSTNYLLYLRYQCTATSVSRWTSGTPIRTTCVFPPMTVTAATVCGQNAATLSADVANASVQWYDRELGGNIISNVNTLITPILNETTRFWVSTLTLNSIDTQVGRMQPELMTEYSALDNHGIVFNTSQDIRLKSVDVYPTSSGTLDLKIVNSSGQEIYSTGNVDITFNEGDGAVTIPLNTEITAGNGYRLLIKSSSGLRLLYDDDDDVEIAYPFQESNGVVSIPASYRGAHVPWYYFYFYNLQFEVGCVSPRQEIIATVLPAPELRLNTTNLLLCEGIGAGLVTIEEGASSYDTYSWNPSVGVSGNAVNGWTFDQYEAQKYTLTASQSSGQQCQTILDLNTLVISDFEPTYIPSSDLPAGCVSDILPLEVVDPDFVVKQIGADSPSYFNSNLSAFNNYRRSARVQMIFTAEELRNSGLTKGHIGSLSFDITTLGASADNDNYTVKIAPTNLGKFIYSDFINADFTTVFTPKTYTHTASGWQEILFDTNYDWDGLSNLIIEIAHDGIDSSSSARTNYTDTAVYSVVYEYNGTNINISKNRFNIKFKQVFPVQVKWTATAGSLFLDETATIPYSIDTHANKVYYRAGQMGATEVIASMAIQTCEKTKVFNVTTLDIAEVQIDETHMLCQQTAISELVAIGQNLRWYRSADRSTPVPETHILEAGDYYVSQTINDCESIPKRFTVNLLTPPVPPLYTSQVYCGTTYLQDINVTYDPNNTLHWYDAADNLIDTNILMTTGSYSFSQSNQGCESVRTTVDIVVNSAPIAPDFSPDSICGPIAVGDLDPQLLPNAIANWYMELDSTVAMEATELLTSRTYYLSQSLGGCESPRTAVQLTINDIPLAPTGNALQEFEGDSVVGDLVTDQDNVVWFESLVDAQENNNSLAGNHPLTDEEVYYGVLFSAEDCWGAPFAVTVKIKLSTQRFDEKQLYYYPNPVSDLLHISYKEKISKVEIYSLSGQLILETNAAATSVEIDMSTLAKATYIVKIFAGADTQSLRVIKQ
ncbi:T9SS type A sorting domain-containing protein [Flavobacterium sp. NKUCC04_CG]|uniref:Ig-like domain-containing protein n=1 Tax=Flavobacterium sp. NKUCC04_CG TaxID=2842121 RepID=UPI001C5BABCC|nr:T9SS type A sorting domain-containing protein [Flavobacterium sp. NKUCC04_CG]MBW3517690.1 T9SS type A sorting domain-containing protein [Flavobacterium sp. NKUCC04_CG]